MVTLGRKRLLRWFADKRMETILKMVDEHLRLTRRAVEELYRMVEAASEGSPADVDRRYRTVSEMEMKADQLRREMVEELTKRDIYPSEREDLMELVRAVDWVADWAREAGRILAIIPFEKAPEELKRAARDMCRADVNGVSVLSKCVKALLREPDKALELANEVEMIEEDIDELYSIARRHLASLTFENFTPGALILLNMFLDALETIADWCENTADIVRAIAVRLH
ncbi:DUF47 family protein [Candidatus Bathyarchaeota archaeon]|nr:MAG: DUF47 family protein [Candidatus Bathyarchaeota archaeon]RLI18900.1 MAG: hypothetical protein DRO49_01665 [Candidatus Bathyarchaeota archaeon]